MSKANRRDNVEALFQAAIMSGLQTNDTGHEKLALNMEDASIKSQAGYTIPNPTYDKVIQYCTELVGREISDMVSGKPEISADLKVQKLQGQGSSLIDTASGQVNIVLDDNKPELTIELPFLVINGEMVPFDVIQVGRERCPYSRENLGKVMMGINQTIEGMGSDGLVGLEPVTNATTSRGFLQDVLNVRARGNVVPDMGGIFVTAEEKKLDGMLKTAATLKPYDWQEVEKVANTFADKIQLEQIKKASDVGIEIEEMVKEASFQSDSVRTLKWERLFDLPHGTFVKFPERNGKELSMTAGKILRAFDFEIPTRQRDVGENVESANRKQEMLTRFWNQLRVLITEDGRMKILTQEDRAIGLRSDKPLFRFHGCKVKDLKKGDTFFMKTPGGKPCIPHYVDRVDKRSMIPYTDFGAERLEEYDKNLNKAVTPTRDKQVFRHQMRYIESLVCSDATKISFYQRLFGIRHMDLSEDGTFNYHLMHKNAPIHDIIPVEDYAANEAAYFSCSPMDLKAMMPYGAKKVTVLSPEKKVVKIRGTVGPLFSSVDAIEEFMYNPEVPSFMKMVKVASANETIDIQKQGEDKFNVTLRYTDRDGQMYQAREEKMVGLSESAALGALIALNFDKTSATDCMLKAKRNGSLHCSLPQGADPNKIFGAKKKKKAVNILVSSMRQTGLDKKIANHLAKNLLANTVGSMSAGIAREAIKDSKLAYSPAFVNLVMDKTASLAEEAEALSCAIEKLAMEQESGFMRKVAKAMALCAHFNRDIGTVYSRPEDYPHFTKLAGDIVESRELFEDMVGDLVVEKLAGYKEQNHKMPVSYYGRCVDHLDKMYQFASALVKEAE